jgi:hypothetical protein
MRAHIEGPHFFDLDKLVFGKINTPFIRKRVLEFSERKTSK